MKQKWKKEKKTYRYDVTLEVAAMDNNVRHTGPRFGKAAQISRPRAARGAGLAIPRSPPSGERAARGGDRREGAGTPDRGHRKDGPTPAKLLVFPRAVQPAGEWEGAPGVRGRRGFLAS